MLRIMKMNLRENSNSVLMIIRPVYTFRESTYLIPKGINFGKKMNRSNSQNSFPQ